MRSRCSAGIFTSTKTQQTKNEPLFILKNGEPLTRTVVNSNLRELLNQLGYPDKEYAPHSFRIGAATTAAAANLPPWLIKTLGRWRSDCYELYIRTPHSIIESVPKKLASVFKTIGIANQRTDHPKNNKNKQTKQKSGFTWGDLFFDSISGGKWCPLGHTSPTVKHTPATESLVLTVRALTLTLISLLSVTSSRGSPAGTWEQGPNSEDPYPHSDIVSPAFSGGTYPQKTALSVTQNNLSTKRFCVSH